MPESDESRSYRDAPTSTVAVARALLAYRELGPRGGTPLVVLTHLGANLDSWDPRVVDGLAEDRHVIALEYRGVGGSQGKVRDTIGAMAADTIATVRALGHLRVDLFGQSMGGMVAQAVVAQAPDLVDRLILASSGPAGGQGLSRMTRVMVGSTLRAVATGTDPKAILFFTRSPGGREAARAYLSRLKERVAGRDAPVTAGVFRAQLAAVHRWAAQEPADLSAFSRPVLIVHGDSDRLVPVANASELVRRIPTATVRVFPDSGHAVVSQHHGEFLSAVRSFLQR